MSISCMVVLFISSSKVHWAPFGPSSSPKEVRSRALLHIGLVRELPLDNMNRCNMYRLIRPSTLLIWKPLGLQTASKRQSSAM